MEEYMMDLIFSSNANKKAGLGIEETRRICHLVFDGQTVDLKNIWASPEHIIRVREVIQHAQALMHIVDAALLKTGLSLRSLSSKSTESSAMVYLFQTVQNAGVFRKCGVSAGSTVFCAPEQVPTEMARELVTFIQRLQQGRPRQRGL